MAAEYRTPSRVFMNFTGSGSASGAYPSQFQAQARRTFSFIEGGHADHLHLLFGNLTGAVQGVDLMVAESDYDHTFTMPGVGETLWLPTMLTPLVNPGVDNTLDTVTISVYFNATGDTTAAASFKCIAEPEEVNPQQLSQGLAATAVVWKWEILDDEQPVIGS